MIRRFSSPSLIAFNAVLAMAITGVCAGASATAQLITVKRTYSTTPVVQTGDDTATPLSPANSYVPTAPESVFQDGATAGQSLTSPVPPEPIVIPEPDSIGSEDMSGRVYISDKEVDMSPTIGLDFDDDCEDCEEGANQLSFTELMSEPYTAYRSEQNSLGWLPGGGDQFGWLDWVTDPYLRRGNTDGVTGAINIHWLSGPYSVPLPPRLYDLSIGYQRRDTINDVFSYDIFASIGLFTDFEDSARDGVRYPSHAVGMVHLDPYKDIVFGVDYISRDDIKLLPVFGMSFHDLLIDNLRMDLVFPRPRIDYMLNDTNRLYLAGYMDGGSWDIEFPDESNHVMTYKDLRLTLGFEIADEDGDLSALELGYVFDRRLELRGVPGHADYGDAFMVRWICDR